MIKTKESEWAIRVLTPSPCLPGPSYHQIRIERPIPRSHQSDMPKAHLRLNSKLLEGNLHKAATNTLNASSNSVIYSITIKFEGLLGMPVHSATAGCRSAAFGGLNSISTSEELKSRREDEYLML